MRLNTMKWLAAAVTGAAIAGSVPVVAFARGGGGHGGGGHGGGHAAAHHEGGHEGEHREGGHGEHPYHPSENHFAHHDENHHDEHHNHHHDDWHHHGWGPGFWGGAAAGYGLGWWGGEGGYWGDGGGYVDNSDNSETVNNDTTPDDNSGNMNADVQDQSQQKFPVDSWPELGITTYDGQNGSESGLVVAQVTPESSAAKAGIVPGDVILAFNGQPATTSDQLDQVMDSANGKFEALVFDARTNRKSTLTGTLDANAQQN